MIARFKVAKHFELDIGDGRFAYRRNHQSIRAEARLDGLYVIRTSEPAARLSAEDTVRAYKALAQVEQLFRSLKGLEVLIRPIRHRDESPTVTTSQPMDSSDVQKTAITLMAPMSSTMARVRTNRRAEAGTRSPSNASTPDAKAMSVVISSPQPYTPGPPTLRAR